MKNKVQNKVHVLTGGLGENCGRAGDKQDVGPRSHRKGGSVGLTMKEPTEFRPRRGEKENYVDF